MITLYFDTLNGCVICNQTSVEFCYKTQNEILPLTYIPYDDNLPPIFTTIKIKNNKVLENKYLLIAKIDSNSFYISFKENACVLLQPTSYFEKDIQLSKKHFIKAVESNNLFYFSIETDMEIYTALTPFKLASIDIKTASISCGELIIINASCEHKRYLNILYYLDDYVSILSCVCDDIVFIDKEIIVIDEINDSMQRIVKRHFLFENGKYCEISREFSYKVTPNISLYSIPYIFLESIFIKDYSFAKTLCSSSCFDNLVSKIEGFDKIILLNNLYKENRVSLLYKEKSQNLIKNFDFIIVNNLIVDVSIVP